MKIKGLALLILMLAVQLTNAQQIKPWNGKLCAVVLTYDDALNVHLDNAIPCLDSAGFKGTFYIIGEAPSISSRMDDWRVAASHGHELGNHSLNHPCDGSMPGRTWVTSENDLSKYTVTRAVNEIKVTNTLLQAIDGKKVRTFAYPCGDASIDTVNYYNFVEKDFAGARGVREGLGKISTINLNNIDSYAINGQSADYMINLVKKAIETHTLLVFLFHGVSGEHNLNVSLEAHSQLIQFLKKQEKDIWVATLVDVAQYVKSKQATK